MRAGVLQLSPVGAAATRIVAAGTPPVTATTFHYGDGERETVELTEPLYAPRRTVLDTGCCSAAQEAGAEARFGAEVERRARSGPGHRACWPGCAAARRARSRPLTIGADGVRSTVRGRWSARVHRGGRRARSCTATGRAPARALRTGSTARDHARASSRPTRGGLRLGGSADRPVRRERAAASPPASAVLAEAAPELALVARTVERRRHGCAASPACPASAPGRARVGTGR